MDAEKDMMAIHFIAIAWEHHAANRHKYIIEIYIFAKYIPELNPLRVC